MRGVILDSDTLAPADLDLSNLYQSLKKEPQQNHNAWQQYPSTAAAETAERIAYANVVVTNKVVIDSELIAAASQLQLICVAATGSNNIDLQAARERGIAVANVASYSTNTVAQHTLMLMLALAGNLYRYQQACRDGSWSRSPFFCRLDYPILELSGRTLGIIGYGAIGKKVAELARALGMHVLISKRPSSIISEESDLEIARTEFNELLTQADIISLHCPLTEHNHQLINAATLQQMKPGALLINTARGGLIDERALITALESGHLGGAALDSISVEPPPANHPLLTCNMPNLILTPHCAWGSHTARQTLVNEIALNIVAFRRGERRNRLD